MALSALVVAIVSALISAGALLLGYVSFRRSGWDLDVIAWIDIRSSIEIHVGITNTGRQGCVISRITYFLTNLSDGEVQAFDHEDGPHPLAPSATIHVTRKLGSLPEVSTIEAWAFTGGRPYKSKKWTCDWRELARPAELAESLGRSQARCTPTPQHRCSAKCSNRIAPY